MLNPLNFISKFIKSSNQKELDRLKKIVEQVNAYEDFTVKPSLMLRKVKGLPLSADITSFVSYQNKYDLGISFRTKAALSIMSVINVYEGFNIGYAYEVPTANRLSEMRVKTHEIMLMFNIDSIKKSKSVSEPTEE